MNKLTPYLKKLSKRHLIIIAVAILTLTSITAGTAHVMRRDNAAPTSTLSGAAKVNADTNDETTKDAKRTENKKDSTTKQNSAASKPADAKPNTPAAAAAKPGSSATTTKPTTTAPKYSTSGDPRSTAYSTTPVTNQADVSTRITQPNQVATGTLIAYSASKGDKYYYGGDLNVGGPITISKSTGPAVTQITVRTPDGSTTSAPYNPWYITYNGILVGHPASPAAGNQWNMTVQAASYLSTGTYVGHIQTMRSDNLVSWQYDGFVIVNIVD